MFTIKSCQERWYTSLGYVRVRNISIDNYYSKDRTSEGIRDTGHKKVSDTENQHCENVASFSSGIDDLTISDTTNRTGRKFKKLNNTDKHKYKQLLTKYKCE